MRRAASMLCTVMLASMLAAPVARAAFSVGTDLGLAVAMPDGADAVTSFQWGGTAFSIFQPGLRVAFTPASPAHEFVLTSSLSVLNGDGETFHQLQLLGGYQLNFPTSSSTNFFATAGVGVLNLGDGDDSMSRLVFGGGAGVRVRIAEGHGGIRVEGRLDHQNAPDSESSSLNVIGLKLGFELRN